MFSSNAPPYVDILLASALSLLVLIIASYLFLRTGRYTTVKYERPGAFLKGLWERSIIGYTAFFFYQPLDKEENTPKLGCEMQRLRGDNPECGRPIEVPLGGVVNRVIHFKQAVRGWRMGGKRALHYRFVSVDFHNYIMIEACYWSKLNFRRDRMRAEIDWMLEMQSEISGETSYPALAYVQLFHRLNNVLRVITDTKERLAETRKQNDEYREIQEEDGETHEATLAELRDARAESQQKHRENVEQGRVLDETEDRLFQLTTNLLAAIEHLEGMTRNHRSVGVARLRVMLLQAAQEEYTHHEGSEARKKNIEDALLLAQAKLTGLEQVEAERRGKKTRAQATGT